MAWLRRPRTLRSAQTTHHPLRSIVTSLLLTLTLLASANGPLAAGLGAGHPAVVHAQSQGGTPNTFDPHQLASDAKTMQAAHDAYLHPPAAATSATPPPPHPIHAIHLAAPLATVTLSATQPTHLVTSDGRLTLDLPAGAVSAADVAGATGGKLQLVVRQLLPGSGSAAGGSGIVSLGTYLLQVIDGNGQLMSQGLRRPATVALTYSDHDSALDLRHVFAVLNAALPDGLNANPDATGAPLVGAKAIGLGTYAALPTTHDAAHHRLTVTAALPTPSTTMTFNTNSPIATFGKPDPFTVDLSGDALTGTIPLDVPAGPGGLTPPVQLSYSSAGVSEQHNPAGAAGWLGEGWNLTMGSISWTEKDSTANTCINGGACTWADTWQLSDPYGTGAELIPPNINVTTYYDDTPNPITASPVTWHTASESYAKIISFQAPFSLPGMAAVPPCFRVWLTNGLMEEFGCTQDSLEFYTTNGQGDRLSAWNLDLITDPRGNQIHLTYTQDMETGPGTLSYPRDAVLSQIAWDSPTCHNAQTACTTTSQPPNQWAPLVAMNFLTSHTPQWLTNTPAGCNTGANLRCDDPLDLSPTNLGAPEVQSTFVLNDIQLQVHANGTWNTLKDYHLSYEQSGPTTIQDPATGLWQSAAGYLDLTKVAVVGEDGVTALPTRTFTYSTQLNFYEDDTFHPNPASNCGPSWNTGNGSGCLLWSIARDGNSRYLTTASNGMGLAQTFSWYLARDNTHSPANQISTYANPFYCTNNPTYYPCNEADDQAWSRTALTQRTDAVLVASTSPPSPIEVDHIVYYTPYLTSLTAQECTDCYVGMYWGNQNSGDYLDYYDGKFMGFARTDAQTPNTQGQIDGSLVKHYFVSTLGWGVYDTGQVTSCPSNMQPINTACHASPWWNVANAAHGRETKVDTYDASGTTLFGEIDTTYQAVCPPSGVSGSGGTYGQGWGNFDGNLVSELDHNNPMAVCDVQTSQVDRYQVDGGPFGSAPHQTATYAYDSYGRVTSVTRTSSDAGGTGNPTSITDVTTYAWNDNIAATSTGATGTYLVDRPALTTIQASGTQVYSCHFHQYDGMVFVSGGGQTGLVYGDETRQVVYSGVQPSTVAENSCDYGGAYITHDTSYDTSGNPITTTDPDGHQGCTVGTSQYSTCTAYDGAYSALPVSSANALNQTSTIAYASDGSGGFGRWPTSATDANGQTTSYAYDKLGRIISVTLPGEGTGLQTQAWTYTVWCTGTAAQTPCVEVDQTQRLTATTILVSRAFYDGFGRLVETRAQAPGGQDVVTYASYNANGYLAFKSNPYFVAAFTGTGSAYSIPDSTQPGTATAYDSLGRGVSVTDTLAHLTTTSYALACGEITGDSGCYEKVSAVDANHHQHATYTDAFGRTLYARAYTGSASPYTVYATTSYTYDFDGHLVKIVHPNGTSATTFTYDRAGRQIGLGDPDRGSETYAYDNDGNRTQSTDARGSSHTVYQGYDGLDRPIYRYAADLPGGTYDDWTYDGGPSGGFGIGRATSEFFRAGSGSLSGSYTYQDDARGRVTRTNQTMGGVGACPANWTCQDVGGPPLGGIQGYVGDGTWTLQSGGSDIWNTSDSMRYMAQNQPGDGEVSARLSAQTPTSPWAKAGIMLRASTAANAADYFVSITPGNGIFVEYRPSTGASAVWVNRIANVTTPIWLKVGRVGTTYTGYSSNDGTTWTAIPGSSVTVSGLSGTVLAGVAASVGSGLGTITVDHLSPGAPAPSTATSYPVSQTYDDADSMLTQTYPTGETVTTSYTPQEWFAGLSTSAGTNTLVNSASYGGLGGAAGLPTSLSLGNGVYTATASYNALLQPTDSKLTRVSDGAVLFEQQPTFDPVGNVSTVATTLPAGTDQQAFCYDEQDRLTWASAASGTIPCGGTNTAGTLTAAQYTQTFAYDTLNRLTSGPLGVYTYGDGAHLHGATSVGGQWTGSYDASGNLTCRAPSSATTCAGTQTGAQLSYDAAGRLSAWQNAPSSPTTTDSFLYDGVGHRVAQQTSAGGTSTTTVYVGDLEQMVTSGATTTTTTYYYAGSQLVAEAVNGAISYLASDGLGSVTAALSPTGTVQATQLYAPYGLIRYSSGTMPTDYGFTGQHGDGTTGLDYYVARYYDPVAGQFASADTVLDGLNRFSYVQGNPESVTDPSGHAEIGVDYYGGGDGYGNFGAAAATGEVIGIAAIAAAAALAAHFVHYIEGIPISTTGTSAVTTPQNSAATGTGATGAPSVTGRLPPTVGDPFADSVDVSSIAAWNAAVLASLHAAGATTAPRWVPPTYYFAKSGGNSGANEYVRELAKSYNCDPVTDPECFEDFSDALHQFKEDNGMPPDLHNRAVAREFAKWHFRNDPKAWDLLFNRLPELLKM